MKIIDLTELNDDFIIHYGGEMNSVNAYTFAHSLVAFADAAKYANTLINPGHELELSVDALDVGSFRASVKTFKNGLKSLFSADSAKNIVLSVVASHIYFLLSQRNPDTQTVTIENDRVIIESPGSKIILPLEVYEAHEKVKDQEKLTESVRGVFEVLEQDDSVENFGIIGKGGASPLLLIDREEFGAIVRGEILPSTTSRTSTEKVELVIVRAILEKGSRRWEFLWRGFRISAPILDQTFYERFAAREFSIAPGDTMVVDLEITQERDDSIGQYVNSKYQILTVHEIKPHPMQGELSTES